MGILEKVGVYLKDQWEFTRDFYHLDYWETHTLAEGYAELTAEITSLTEDKLQGSHDLV